MHVMRGLRCVPCAGVTYTDKWKGNCQTSDWKSPPQRVNHNFGNTGSHAGMEADCMARASTSRAVRAGLPPRRRTPCHLWSAVPERGAARCVGSARAARCPPRHVPTPCAGPSLRSAPRALTVPPPRLAALVRALSAAQAVCTEQNLHLVRSGAAVGCGAASSSRLSLSEPGHGHERQHRCDPRQRLRPLALHVLGQGRANNSRWVGGWPPHLRHGAACA